MIPVFSITALVIHRDESYIRIRLLLNLLLSAQKFTIQRCDVWLSCNFLIVVFDLDIFLSPGIHGVHV